MGRLTVDAYVSGGVIESGSPYLSFLATKRGPRTPRWVAADDRGIVGTVTITVGRAARQGEAEIRTLAVAPRRER